MSCSFFICFAAHIQPFYLVIPNTYMHLQAFTMFILNNPMTLVLPVRLDRQNADQLPAGYETDHEQASWPESVRRTWDPFRDGDELPASPDNPKRRR